MPTAGARDPVGSRGGSKSSTSWQPWEPPQTSHAGSLPDSTDNAEMIAMPWSGVLPASDATAGPGAAQIAQHRRRIVVTALWVFGRIGWRGTPEQMKRSG